MTNKKINKETYEKCQEDMCGFHDDGWQELENCLCDKYRDVLIEGRDYAEKAGDWAWVNWFNIKLKEIQ